MHEGTDPFLQDDGVTMKNRLGIENPEALRFAEHELSDGNCAVVGIVEENFSEHHLRDIYYDPFERDYNYAGAMRHGRLQ